MGTTGIRHTNGGQGGHGQYGLGVRNWRIWGTGMVDVWLVTVEMWHCAIWRRACWSGCVRPGFYRLRVEIPVFTGMTGWGQGNDEWEVQERRV